MIYIYIYVWYMIYICIWYMIYIYIYNIIYQLLCFTYIVKIVYLSFLHSIQCSNNNDDNNNNDSNNQNHHNNDSFVFLGFLDLVLLLCWFYLFIPECGFTLKCILDIIRTYSQVHCTDKYSQHISIIWSVWLNGWVFVYELSGCGFESRYSHFT